MTDPISIALLGAPGSNKSEVAFSFMELVENDRSSNGTMPLFRAIDDIPRELEEDGDLAVGIHGAYLVNMLIAVRRFDTERFFRRTEQSFITVGTVVETMAHGAHNIELMSMVQGEEMQKRITREMHATTTLTFMFLDTFKYSYGFYIPLSQVVLPTENAQSTSYEQSIDKNIELVFKNFGFELPTLTGTVDEMAQTMFELIKEREAAKELEPTEAPEMIGAKEPS